MLRCLLFLFYLILCTTNSAQNFESYFVDKTLRLDYILAGSASEQAIYLSQLSAQEHWAGRRNNLDKLPLKGNGQIFVTDLQTQATIYCTSFSTLFQEWINTPEALKLSKSFQNTILIPMPKNRANVSVVLFDSYGNEKAKYTHQIDPLDVLIRRCKKQPSDNVFYTKKSGPYSKCIDIAILSEGYADVDKKLFDADARLATQLLFEHEPFATYANLFNVVAVYVPSAESGVSIPRNNDWKQTALGAHYSTFYSDRYLTTPNVFAIHDALQGVDYEHLIILANTPEYGGGGIYNSYTLTSSRHNTFSKVLVHEFGHSFGGLADEYCYADEVDTLTYPPSVEPWEQNITTQVDFASKWEKKMDEDGVGLVEGAGYSCKNIYRSAPDCRMRTNECRTFCKVCTDAIVKLILFYTEMITQE